MINNPENFQPKKIEQKEDPVEIKFNIQKLIEVSDDVLEGIKKGMTLIWEKNIKEPVEFKIVIASYLLNPITGEPIKCSCEYIPNTDTFVFAMNTIQEEDNLGLPLDTTMILLAAHEAMHKVQHFKGRKLKPSHDLSGNFFKGYHDDEDEIEAWEEALRVFKKIFPESHGELRTGNRKFTIPDVS